MSHQHMEDHILSLEGEMVIERNADGEVVSEKSYQNVLHGLESAAKRKNTSPAKAKDAEAAWELKQCHDGHHNLHPHVTRPAHSSYKGDTTHPGETHDETVHRHRQVGSLRAQLKRSGRSEETKERIRTDSGSLGRMWMRMRSK